MTMTQAWAIKSPDGEFICSGKTQDIAWAVLNAICLANNEDAETGGYTCVPVTLVEGSAEPSCEVALNVRHKDCHKAADAFWQYWRENGATHKHGYFESTWGAINQALRYVGVIPHTYSTPRIEVTRTSLLGEIDAMTPNQEGSAEPVLWVHPDALDSAALGVTCSPVKLGPSQVPLFTTPPAASSVEPVAWRFRFPTGTKWHYTDLTEPNWYSKPQLTWEPLFTAPPADDARRLLDRADALLSQAIGYVESRQMDEEGELTQDIKDHLARSGK